MENFGANHISKQLNDKKFSLAPRFTIVHHPIKEKFGLTFSAYAIIDSVHQLSHRPDHPWCTVSKEKLGTFLDVGRTTVHKAINDDLELGLIFNKSKSKWRKR